jgi:hypothetical protein
MGLRPPQGMKKASVRGRSPMETPLSPLSSRPERSEAEGPAVPLTSRAPLPGVFLRMGILFPRLWLRRVF